jgi:hypothetical protein
MSIGFPQILLKYCGKSRYLGILFAISIQKGSSSNDECLRNSMTGTYEYGKSID